MKSLKHIKNGQVYQYVQRLNVILWIYLLQAKVFRSNSYNLMINS